MPNLRKKINKLAPMVISAALLLSVSVAAYGYYGDEDYDPWNDPWYDPWDDPWDDSSTYTEPPVSTTTTDMFNNTDTTTTTRTPSQTTTTRPAQTTTTRPAQTTTTARPSQTTTGNPTTQTTTPVSGSGTDVPDETTTDLSEETTPDLTETTEPIVNPPQMSLSFSERWLTVGEGTQLNAQVINTEEPYPVSFASSNTNVVRVDASGYIIAVGAGSAVVTASSGEIKGYATVYVSEPPVVPEFLVLTENSFILKIDETVKIQAKLLPEEAAEGYEISYVSNDPSIVKVDENGVITALHEGETTITVEGADLQETVYVTVSSDIAYDTARLDGYLYNGKGKPVSGTHLTIGELSAVTDKDGYFVFDDAEQRSLTIRLADDPNAACGLTVSGDTTVYLLYDSDSGALTRLSSYDELAGQLAIDSVQFDTVNIVLTAGEVFELGYQYEPSDATVTAINYTSSNSVAASVGQVDGVITAKSPGETIITISLNNGQAMAECYITVNPRESSEHSVLIIVIEASVFAIGTAAVLLSYRSYKRRALSAADEEEEDEDLHDID